MMSSAVAGRGWNRATYARTVLGRLGADGRRDEQMFACQALCVREL